MAFRSENQKISLDLLQVETLLGLPEGVEVTGFHTHRDPPVLEIYLYNPHVDPDQAVIPTDAEIPIVQHKVDL